MGIADRRIPTRKKGRADTPEEGSRFDAGGKIAKLELENFMCHANLKLEFEVRNKNCFYITGENGTGKSAIFAALNMGLGGRASATDRGDKVQSYIKKEQPSSFIRVTLLNVEPNPYPNYGDYITVERKITQNNSSYRLLDARGAVKSTKKADLDKILSHFKIEIDNPLSWLSQDKARYFLQEMKPEKLYEMYLAASQISKVEEIYHDIRGTLADRDEQYKKAKEKRDACKERVKELDCLINEEHKLETRRKHSEHYNWMLLFANPLYTEETIREQEAKLQKQVQLSARAQEKIVQCQAREQEFTESLDAKTAAIDELNNRIKELQPQVDALKKAKGALSGKEAQLKHDKGEATKRRKVLENDIRKTTEQINKYCAGSSGNFEQEIEKIEAEIAKLTAEAKEVQQRIESQRKHADEIVRQGREELHRATQQCQHIDNQIRREENSKKQMAMAQNNRLALFGTDVPRIVKLVEDNARLFKSKPLGPIGNYITLRDGKWASPVEFVLGKALSRFICSSPEDRRTLERICRENGINNPSVTSLSYSAVKYRVNEPDERFVTVLRVINVEEPTVFNYLVDQMSIDNIILMEGEDETRRLMRNPPPGLNVRRAVTLECSEVHAPSEMMPYRFYSNRRMEPKVFSQKASTFDEAKSNFELGELHARARTAKQEKEKAESALREAEQERDKLMTGLSVDYAQLKKIGSTIAEKKARQDELSKLTRHESLIEDLRASLKEDEQKLQQCLAEIGGYDQSLEKLSEERKEFNERWDKVQSDRAKYDLDVKAHENEKQDLDDKLKRARQEKDKHSETIAGIETVRKHLEVVIATLKDELEKLCAKRDREKDKFEMPPNFTDPPDDQLPSPTHISDEKEKNDYQIALIEQKIGDAKAKYGGSTDELHGLLVCEQAELYGCEKEVNHWKPVFKNQNEAQRLEAESHAGRKIKLPKSLQETFSDLMQMRGYIGELRFDHDMKSLTIHVETHGERPTEVQRGEQSGRLQKTRAKREISQLSGGERSFSTSCFVMALWEAVVESPFRLMDEFDIFMDQQNRRLTMENLTDVAREQPRRQFIFFTPQTLGGIRNMDNIQVFDLGKKQAVDGGGREESA